MKIKTLLESLEEAEGRLDCWNWKEGTENMFCLCCLANKYDAKQGIIHTDDCVITALRFHIKRLKEVKPDNPDE